MDDLQVPLIMDKAYEGNETRRLPESLEFQPVVPPKANWLDPWVYDVDLSENRHEIERSLGRDQRFRRVFPRYDETDVMFRAFVTVALVANLLRQCEHVLEHASTWGVYDVVRTPVTHGTLLRRIVM